MSCYLNNHKDGYSFSCSDVLKTIVTGFSGITYAQRHWQIYESNGHHKNEHLALAIFQSLPVLGGIIALIEGIAFLIFQSFKENVVLPKNINPEQLKKLSYLELSKNETPPSSKKPNSLDYLDLKGDLTIPRTEIDKMMVQSAKARLHQSKMEKAEAKERCIQQAIKNLNQLQTSENQKKETFIKYNLKENDLALPTIELRLSTSQDLSSNTDNFGQIKANIYQEWNNRFSQLHPELRNIWSRNIITKLDFFDEINLSFVCRGLYNHCKQLNKLRIKEFIHAAMQIDQLLTTFDHQSLIGINDWNITTQYKKFPCKFDVDQWISAARAMDNPKTILAKKVTWHECKLDLLETLADYGSDDFFTYLFSQNEEGPSKIHLDPLILDLCIEAKAIETIHFKIHDARIFPPDEKEKEKSIIQKLIPRANHMWVKLDYFPSKPSELISDYVLAECLIGLRQGNRVLVAEDLTRTVKLTRTTPKFILRCHQGDMLFDHILRKQIDMGKNLLTQFAWKEGFSAYYDGQTYQEQINSADYLLGKIDQLIQERLECEKKANMQKTLKGTGRKRAISIS